MGNSKTNSPILELESITKTFGDNVANKNVNLDLYPGVIHAIVGENGAGKSTLMNVLFGIHKADSGVIRVDGNEVIFEGPQDAIDNGIGMVHQHFMLVPSFTVAENVVLGAEPGRRGLFVSEEAVKQTEVIAEKIGIRIDPHAVVGELGVATQQKLEIMKVLYRGASIIILDEPTAVLTPAETRELFKLLKSLARDENAAIVFISHKLGEVFEIADQITVLRRGETVASFNPNETNTE